MKTTHVVPFYEGDRVCLMGSNAARVATFMNVCVGYRSHCVVRWEDDGQTQRLRVKDLQLVERSRV